MLAIRPYAEADRDAVNAVARAAFAQYSQDYQDWPSFIEGIGRMADLARDADLLVAEQDGVVVGAVAHVGPGRPRAAFFPGEWSVIRMLVVDPARRGQGSALRMYEAMGFVRDRDLAPIRGVPYGRYVLEAKAPPAVRRG